MLIAKCIERLINTRQYPENENITVQLGKINSSKFGTPSRLSETKP